MMSYENAPSTRMLATDCACCGRPLRDAVSAERGIGPDCARRHGYGNAQAAPNWKTASEVLADVAPLEELAPNVEPRACANALIHRIACEQSGPRVVAMTMAVHALGFHKVAITIAKRIGAVVIELEGTEYLVRSPYSEAFNAAIRACRGQRWDGERRVRRVPQSERMSLWVAIRRAFGAGTLVIGRSASVV